MKQVFCLDCGIEITKNNGKGQQPQRCPEHIKARLREMDRQKHQRFRQQNPLPTAARICKAHGCEEPILTQSNASRYCEKHVAESRARDAANKRAWRERKRLERGPIEKVKKEPVKKKSAKVEKDTRDGYVAVGLSELKGPPKANDPKRKRNDRRELPAITSLTPDRAVCNCGRKWWIVKSFDVARGTIPLYVQVGQLQRVDKCPRCNSTPARIGTGNKPG